MNLDDYRRFHEIDKHNMLGEIKNLPDQLNQAWKIANEFPLPPQKTFEKIILSGMGGSAIGADILQAYVNSFCNIPIIINRGYQLPSWANNEQVLVVCSSHSGNTEETIAVFEEAISNKCTVISLSTGGALYDLSSAKGGLAWKFNHQGQPRAAVGFSFTILLNLFSRMDWIPDQWKVLEKTVEETKSLMLLINESSPVTQNLAKRIAGQAINRFPVVFSAEHLEPVGRRWKTQLNELSKCWASFEFIPEANHNTLAGLVYPESTQHNYYSIFLDSDHYLTQNKKRIHLTAEEFMVSGFCTDIIKTEVSDKLAEIWRLILLGDFMAFYLAMLYEVDPTPVKALEDFKSVLKK